MKYKKLGRTGMTVSRLCLGTGNWGYSDEPYGNWATTNEKEAFRIMDAALDAGINFFDCANVYGNHGAGTTGTSEEIIGKWFKQGGGRREKVILGTKVGREMYNNDYDGPNRPEGLSLYKIRAMRRGLCSACRPTISSFTRCTTWTAASTGTSCGRHLRALSAPERSIMSAHRNLPAGNS